MWVTVSVTGWIRCTDAKWRPLSSRHMGGSRPARRCGGFADRYVLAARHADRHVSASQMRSIPRGIRDTPTEGASSGRGRQRNRRMGWRIGWMLLLRGYSEQAYTVPDDHPLVRATGTPALGSELMEPRARCRPFGDGPKVVVMGQVDDLAET